MRLNLVLLGAPGAGKGTQAKLLASKYNIPHIATGDMFRKAVAERTKLGLEVEKYLVAGRLVPDELTIEVVRERLAQADCRNGFILDGYPRTVPQAEALAKLTELDAVIDIKVPVDELVRRISGRRSCPRCGAVYNIFSAPPKVPEKCDRCLASLFQRNDDREDVVKKRLEVYQRQTEPLIGYYKERKLLHEVEGAQGIEGTFKKIETIIEKHLIGQRRWSKSSCQSRIS